MAMARGQLSQQAQLLRNSLLELNEAVKPMHEWLEGQRAHFESQGYTPEQARALASATFVTIFGQGMKKSDGE